MRKLRPSDVRTFAFCPRLYFFERHLGREVSLLQKLRMLLGKLWHLIVEIKYEEKEIPLRGELFGFEVVGRADAVTEDAVVEIKSADGPSDGAWYGDYLQASIYALLANKNKIVIKYRNGEREFEPDGEEVERIFRLVEMIEDGYLPPPKRSRWCAKCPFKELCEALGDDGDGWFPRLPYVKRL